MRHWKKNLLGFVMVLTVTLTACDEKWGSREQDVTGDALLVTTVPAEQPTESDLFEEYKLHNPLFFLSLYFLHL